MVASLLMLAVLLREQDHLPQRMQVADPHAVEGNAPEVRRAATKAEDGSDTHLSWGRRKVVHRASIRGDMDVGGHGRLLPSSMAMPE